MTSTVTEPLTDERAVSYPVPPCLLVHYAPGVLAVLRRDQCPKHATDYGRDHCGKGGLVLTVVSISGLEPGETGWVLERCWLPRRQEVLF